VGISHEVELEYTFDFISAEVPYSLAVLFRWWIPLRFFIKFDTVKACFLLKWSIWMAFLTRSGEIKTDRKKPLKHTLVVNARQIKSVRSFRVLLIEDLNLPVSCGIDLTSAVFRVDFELSVRVRTACIHK
jgi:hypothetical protein